MIDKSILDLLIRDFYFGLNLKLGVRDSDQGHQISFQPFHF